MGTKFTPGPWTPYCQDDTSTDRPVGDDGVRFWDISAAGPFRGGVATVHAAAHIGGITLEERDANAHLIAAAPALYEPAADAIDILDVAIDLWNDAYPDEPDEVFTDLQRRFREAVALAARSAS